MSGYGYGYGYGVKAPGGGGLPAPPLGDLIAWIHPQDVVVEDWLGTDYIEDYNVQAGSYSGGCTANSTDVSRQKWADSSLNALELGTLLKPTGGMPSYILDSELGPYNNFSFGMVYWTVARTSPVYVTGSNTYWNNGCYVSHTRKMGMRVASTFYDTTAVDVVPLSTYLVQIFTFERNVAQSIRCFQNAVEVTSVAANVNNPMYLKSFMSIESNHEGRVGDQCAYSATLGLDSVNELGQFLSNKYALGQTWELS